MSMSFRCVSVCVDSLCPRWMHANFSLRPVDIPFGQTVFWICIRRTTTTITTKTINWNPFTNKRRSVWRKSYVNVCLYLASTMWYWSEVPLVAHGLGYANLNSIFAEQTNERVYSCAHKHTHTQSENYWHIFKFYWTYVFVWLTDNHFMFRSNLNVIMIKLPWMFFFSISITSEIFFHEIWNDSIWMYPIWYHMTNRNLSAFIDFLSQYLTAECFMQSISPLNSNKRWTMQNRVQKQCDISGYGHSFA